ncbi:MAG: malate dehydrogenase [Aigarchaeota archaeon]|nr:malate dehydrogenase [Candidatus Wolframiiraptor gerlachensis]
MKVGIVGAGRVGSTAAYTLLSLMDLDELVLVDVLGDLAEGEALDLMHAAYALGKRTRIHGGSDYDLLRGSNLIIVTAGAARKPGMSRLDLLKTNAEIMRRVAASLKDVCGDAVIMVVSNPVDLMTYLLWRELGIPRHRIMGMGGILDTARLWSILGQRSDDMVLGEHGDSMFIRGGHHDLEEQLKGLAMEVIRRKGATVYGPAASIYIQAKAILADSQEILPVSAILDGEYGLRNIAVGVPARIGREGIIEIIEYEDARDGIIRSASILRERLHEAGY